MVRHAGANVRPERVDPPQEAGSEPQRPAPETSGLRAAISYCLRVFICVRLGLFLLGLVSVALFPMNDVPSVPGWTILPSEGWHNLFTAWERWDALWFLRIATDGYAAEDGSAAFFPLYPLLIRGLSPFIGGHPLAAALIISNACFFAGLVVLHLVSEEEYDRPFARKTVLYMAIFPTAFFYVAPYTESLFLLLSCSCFLFVRRDRWAAAGLMGALAAATRSIGILLVLPLLVEAFKRRRPGERSWSLVARVAWSLSVGAGTLAYLLFWAMASGNFWAPLTSQGGWARELSPFWASIGSGTKEALRSLGTYPAGYHQLDWLMVMVALVAAVWVARRARLVYVVYTLPSLLIPLSLIFGGRPFMSLPRFLLPLFPLFWALARFAERFRAHELVIGVSAAGLGVMTALFVTWYFVF